MGIDTAALDAAIMAAIIAAKVAMISFLKTTLPLALRDMLFAFFKDFLLETVVKKWLTLALAQFFIRSVIVIILAAICEFLVEIILDAIMKALQIVTITDKIMTLPVIEGPLKIIQTIATSLLFLFAVYSGFKAFFAYFGFEAEEPIKIIFRVSIAAVAILAAPSIATYALKINAAMINVLWSLFIPGAHFDGSVPGDLINDFKNAIYPTHIDNPLDLLTIQFDMLLFLFFVYRMIMLLMKFATRYITCILLIIASPLAYAAWAVKETKEYFKGWLNLFLGTLLVQCLQVGVLSIMFAFPRYFGNSVMDKILLYFIILGFMELMEQADEIVRALGLSTSMATGQLFEAAKTAVISGQQSVNKNYSQGEKWFSDKVHKRQTNSNLDSMMGSLSHLPGAPKSKKPKT